MIKRIFIILAAAAAAVSCLKGSGYETTYQARVFFDDFGNREGDDFFGDDKLYFGSYMMANDVVFAGRANDAKTDFSAFGLSKATLKDDIDEGRHSVNAESAASGEVFAIFHNNPDIEVAQHVIFARAGYGTCAPLSCKVNNTKFVADRIAEYNEQHEESAEVRLIATGYAGGSETGKAEICLAIPGASSEARDSIMSSWTTFDLKDLGNVDYINFSMTFSDGAGDFIPEYFCMDDFFADIHIKIDAE